MLQLLNEERTISNWIGTINPDTKRVGIYLFVSRKPLALPGVQRSFSYE
jgi:hypothetical protein